MSLRPCPPPSGPSTHAELAEWVTRDAAQVVAWVSARCLRPPLLSWAPEEMARAAQTAVDVARTLACAEAVAAEPAGYVREGALCALMVLLERAYEGKTVSDALVGDLRSRALRLLRRMAEADPSPVLREMAAEALALDEVEA